MTCALVYLPSNDHIPGGGRVLRLIGTDAVAFARNETCSPFVGLKSFTVARALGTLTCNGSMGSDWVRTVRDDARARVFDEADDHADEDDLMRIANDLDLGELCEGVLRFHRHPGCDHFAITEDGLLDGGAQKRVSRNYVPMFEGLQHRDRGLERDDIDLELVVPIEFSRGIDYEALCIIRASHYAAHPNEWGEEDLYRVPDKFAMTDKNAIQLARTARELMRRSWGVSAAGHVAREWRHARDEVLQNEYEDEIQ